MAYVALRVLRADGRQYQPGETIDGDPQTWRSYSYLVSHGYIAGHPDLQSAADEELASLREQAKQLGIKGYGNMKAETLRAKISEITELQDDPDKVLDPAGGTPSGPGEQQPSGEQTPQTGGDGDGVDILGGSNQQPEGSNSV